MKSRKIVNTSKEQFKIELESIIAEMKFLEENFEELLNTINNDWDEINFMGELRKIDWNNEKTKLELLHKGTERLLEKVTKLNFLYLFMYSKITKKKN